MDVFQAAFNARIPLYFIGDDLARSATYALEGTPQKTNWVNLIHLNATAINFGGNRTFGIVNQTHPVVNGPFGVVGDSNYGYDPDATTRTGTGEILLGVSGPHDVLVAFKDPTTATKTVTQNILPATQTDAAGIEEKKKLSKNAVTWLLAKDPVGRSRAVLHRRSSPGHRRQSADAAADGKEHRTGPGGPRHVGRYASGRNDVRFFRSNAGVPGRQHADLRSR